MSEARQNLAAVVERARADHTPVYLERHGRRVAAVIDSDDLDILLSLAEDMEDLRAAATARREARESSAEAVPWDEVKRDLGLI